MRILSAVTLIASPESQPSCRGHVHKCTPGTLLPMVHSPCRAQANTLICTWPLHVSHSWSRSCSPRSGHVAGRTGKDWPAFLAAVCLSFTAALTARTISQCRSRSAFFIDRSRYALHELESTDNRTCRSGHRFHIPGAVLVYRIQPPRVMPSLRPADPGND